MERKLLILMSGLALGLFVAFVVAATLAIRNNQSQPASQIAEQPAANQQAKEAQPEVPPKNQPTTLEKEKVRHKVRMLGATGQFEEIAWEAKTANQDHDDKEFLGKTSLNVRRGDRGVILHLRSTDGAKWRTGYAAMAFYSDTGEVDFEAEIDGRKTMPMNNCPPSERQLREKALLDEWNKAMAEDMNRKPADRVGVPPFMEFMQSKQGQ